MAAIAALGVLQPSVRGTDSRCIRLFVQLVGTARSDILFVHGAGTLEAVGEGAAASRGCTGRGARARVRGTRMEEGQGGVEAPSKRRRRGGRKRRPRRGPSRAMPCHTRLAAPVPSAHRRQSRGASKVREAPPVALAPSTAAGHGGREGTGSGGGADGSGGGGGGTGRGVRARWRLRLGRLGSGAGRWRGTGRGARRSRRAAQWRSWHGELGGGEEETEGGGRLGGAWRGGRDGDAGAVAGSLADGLGSGPPPE